MNTKLYSERFILWGRTDRMGRRKDHCITNQRHLFSVLVESDLKAVKRIKLANTLVKQDVLSFLLQKPALDSN